PGVRVLVDNLIVPYGGVPFFYVLKKLIYQVLNTTNNYEIGSFIDLSGYLNYFYVTNTDISNYK
ncbi:hypothetical protein, partial [Alkalibacterium psychrotolerans]